MSTLGLDPDRVSSLDEHGHRRQIIPASVRGRFHNQRRWLHAALIIFFLALPWTRINGHQSLLLDIPHREFAIFGLKLYAHDVPLIFFVLALLTLGLGFITAVWGRWWCGWACPQTVFIDGVFRRIEQLAEGSYLQRRQMQNAPWTLNKISRRVLKWLLFFLASSLIAHSFAAYFVGAEELVKMMGTAPSENWAYFVLISSLTALILFDFAWFREQFCLIMCPYGRFQGLLMDSTSLAPLYDSSRGEPRKGQTKPGEKAGDCVSCRRCVEVCPTGIDIRKGLQMECIACTACIDACDEIMDKVKKPRGLIRYTNLRGTTWSIKKPRALIYLVLIFVAALGLTFSLQRRGLVDVVILRGQEALYQEIKTPDGQTLISNHIRLHVRNQSGAPLQGQLEVQAGAERLEVATMQNPLELREGEDRTVHLFVKFPPSLLGPNGDRDAVLRLRFPQRPQEPLEKVLRLLGPVHP